MQKISIRLEDSDVAKIDSFAVAHGMSRAASTEFFVKFGMREFIQHEANTEMAEKLESMNLSISKAFETLYRASAYLTMSGAMDNARFEKAAEAAERAKSEIFRHE